MAEPTPAMAPPVRSLHRKLAQIMHEVGRIPKNGTAPAVMGGYKFVQVGDATDVIRKALADAVITMIPTKVEVVSQVDRPTAKGGNMTTVDLLTEWTLTDGESGESITIMSYGAGADGGDKYSGKASTSAMKYALLTGFLLSTGDDTEASVLPEQRARRTEVYSAANPPPPEPLRPASDGSLIGIAKIGTKNTSDGELRETPDGWRLGFRLQAREGDRGGYLVEVNDELAEAMATVRSDWVDQPVTVWGKIEDRSFPSKGRTVTYQAFVLSKIQTPSVTLPVPEPDTIPLFSPEEDAALDAAIGA